MKKKFTIYSGEKTIHPQISVFPGGEVNVRVNEPVLEDARIEAYIFNSDDLMTLIMLVDALRNMDVARIRLTMPYVPYARQDRVFNAGEAAIKVRVASQRNTARIYSRARRRERSRQ